MTFPGAERTSRRLGAGLVAQAKREDGAVVLDGAALLEALKDLLAHGVELLAVVDGEFLLEELIQDLRALVVALLAEGLLQLRAQEAARDALAVHLHLVERVAEERAARRGEPIHFHVHAAAAREIFPRYPLGRKADLEAAYVLVRDEHIARLRAVYDLLQQQVRLDDPLAGGEGPVGADALAAQRGLAADGGLPFVRGSYRLHRKYRAAF